jgi:hypothetical protein
LARGQSLVARVNRVRLHIVCLHHLFWDGSKVSGTKRCNKTTGAYSGIPGDDMRARRLKAELKVCAWPIGGEPLAVALRGRSPRVPGAPGYM